jgi:hypothetical protein
MTARTNSTAEGGCRRSPEVSARHRFVRRITYGGLMRKRQPPETNEQRSVRQDSETQRRRDDSAAEDRALDALVRQSIKQHGP